MALAAVVLGNASVLAQGNDEAKRVAEGLRAEYLKTYNAHDVRAVTALFAQNAAVTYPRGEMARGRDAVQQRFRAFFAEYDNVKLDIVIESARFNSPQVLLVDIVAELSDGPPHIPPRTFHTVVFQRQGEGQWRIATIRPNPRPERP
jgi:uncharacterized protein (TIGR02246 family)